MTTIVSPYFQKQWSQVGFCKSPTPGKKKKEKKTILWCWKKGCVKYMKIVEHTHNNIHM